jgi:hypothetical protein
VQPEIAELVKECSTFADQYPRHRRRVICLGDAAPALMLVFLAFAHSCPRRVKAEAGGFFSTRTASTVHAHRSEQRHVHIGSRTFAIRSLVVGLIHGLAGSGALTARVVADLPTAPARLAYIAVFGVGSIVGMALLTGAVDGHSRGWAGVRGSLARWCSALGTLAPRRAQQ